LKFNKKARQLLNASTIGISFVTAIVIGTFMGYFLDKYFDTKPYLTLIFMILGVAAGFKNMIYFLKKSGIFDKEDK
jgi:ATP synthase protein I